MGGEPQRYTASTAEFEGHPVFHVALQRFQIHPKAGFEPAVSDGQCFIERRAAGKAPHRKTIEPAQRAISRPIGLDYFHFDLTGKHITQGSVFGVRDQGRLAAKPPSFSNPENRVPSLPKRETRPSAAMATGLSLSAAETATTSFCLFSSVAVLLLAREATVCPESRLRGSG